MVVLHSFSYARMTIAYDMLYRVNWLLHDAIFSCNLPRKFTVVIQKTAPCNSHLK